MTSTNMLTQLKGIKLCNEQLKMLLDGCIVNQRTAQKGLYITYFGYVMSVTLRYGNNYDDAVEIANNAFLKAYKSLKLFLPKSDCTVALFTAWLRGIAVNTSVDYIRKYMKNGECFVGNIEQLVFEDAKETNDPLRRHKEILNCIVRLPVVYKAVFNLHVVEGLSHAEIADKLCISKGTSERNLHEARRIIKLLLKKGTLVNYDWPQLSPTG